MSSSPTLRSLTNTTAPRDPPESNEPTEALETPAAMSVASTEASAPKREHVPDSVHLDPLGPLGTNQERHARAVFLT
jgi:hypothetical protein